MKLKNLTLALALILSTFSTAKAALLIEPVLGYNLGTKVDVSDVKEYSGGKGVAYGGRLGYQNFGFQLGVDYLASTIDMGSNRFKEDLKTSEWAGFVGFEFPILLRVYAGYIFSGTGETDWQMAGLTQELELKGGTGPKFGVGFTVLPFLDINVEYRSVSYDERKWGGVKLANDVDYNTYLLSISLPFTI